MNQSEARETPEKFPVEAYCRISWSLVKQGPGTLEVTPLKCKCWTCLRCGPKKQKQLQYLARSGKPTKMLTLTAGPGAGESPEEKARNLRNAWLNVRRRARRTWKTGKIEFLAVFEKTEVGTPHLHILTRMKYIPQKWISNAMAEMIHSPIVDIRKVRNKRMAAAYVSKYIAKAPERYDGCKRYWRSMDFTTKQKPGKDMEEKFNHRFYVLPTKSENVIKYMTRHGYTVPNPEKTSSLRWERDGPSPIYPGHLDAIWR